MLVTVEPRYTNIRPGDLAVTAAHSLLSRLHQKVLTPAEGFTERDQINALEALGFTPDPASFAQVPLDFVLTAPLGSVYTITASSEWGTPNRAQVFKLDAPVVFAIGQTTKSGTGTATVAGKTGNVAAGTVTQNYNNVAFIASVTNPQEAQNGEDAETTADFLTRAAGEFRAHNAAVKAVDFETIAEAVEGIARARCLIGTRFVAPSTFTPNSPGYVTVLALPNDGGTLTTLVQTATYDALAARTFADIVENSGLAVTDFQRVNLTWVYVIDVKVGYQSADVLAACNAALTTAYSPLSWNNEDGDVLEVTPYDGAAILKGVTGVASVKSVTLNGSSSAAVAVGSLQLPQLAVAPSGSVVP
ncbi:MAG: hypothetical protein HC933_10995 [Pleurocapsa sp. SU_196_0]|nr:hypothetical protein [Pleurocapsa sp. SU_196_0]